MRPDPEPTSVDRAMTIGGLAEACRVSRRTIRHCEEIGLLQPRGVECDAVYGAGDELRLRIVLAGRRLGLSLVQIAQLIGPPDDRSGEVEVPPRPAGSDDGRRFVRQGQGGGLSVEMSFRDWLQG